ncbi:hypothetical protein PQO03_18650 [Lentisphaera profundi]|uniref:Uncharacterized protein n=1 Tax=Lentisphaera profundi TaxID=1658616 RepID=A0ABY7VUG2_9BACT|nr:DUF6694 family lipoprotein [Lentisphaera profundi]WDE97848.1 hypothetical protein PQO03_18650 [Lentisphaera profundi]
MNKTIAFILMLLFVSCSEPKLDELTLDYSSEEAMNDSFSDIYATLTKEQWQRFMQVLSTVTQNEIKKLMPMEKKLSSEEWNQLIYDIRQKAFDGKSVKEILDMQKALHGKRVIDLIEH